MLSKCWKFHFRWFRLLFAPYALRHGTQPLLYLRGLITALDQLPWNSYSEPAWNAWMGIEATSYKYQIAESSRNRLQGIVFLCNSPACWYRLCHWNWGKLRCCAVCWESLDRSLSFFFLWIQDCTRTCIYSFQPATRMYQNYPLSVFVGFIQ